MFFLSQTIEQTERLRKVGCSSDSLLKLLIVQAAGIVIYMSGSLLFYPPHALEQQR